MLEMWARGVSASRIAAALGMGKDQVIGRLHRLGAPQRGLPPGLDRARPVTGAVDEALRARITALWSRGCTAREIAAEIGGAWTRHRVAHAARIWGLTRDPAAAPPRRVVNLAGRLARGAPRAPEPRQLPPPIPRDLRASGCRWPLWGLQERPTHLYCGAPISAGCAFPWCDAHRAIGTARQECGA